MGMSEFIGGLNPSYRVRNKLMIIDYKLATYKIYIVATRNRKWGFNCILGINIQ
jgi:hypothetical protein